tara:strand:- start:71 stop:1003 length:933 start_codon:yes stop_codon:yes gene_type:complete
MLKHTLLKIFIGLSVLLGIISSGCANDSSVNTQNNNEQRGEIDPGEPADSVASFQVIMAVTDIAIGKNRLAFAIIGKNGPLIADEILVKLSPLGSAADTYKLESKAVFQTWPKGNAGVYIARVNLGTPGEWIIQAEDSSGNRGVFGASKFFVKETSSAPAVGTKPKPLNNLTIADVDNINKITSALNPDPDLYKISVAQAMNNGMPTIITFASPSFCRTATCGPQIEVISSISQQFGHRLNVIHIEVYERSEIDDDGNYELTISSLLEAWGLNTEPFSFMLDKTGIVVAKFEGFVTEAELTETISAILDL